MSALAEDAVSVRKVRARGVSETVLRRQLAGIATPRVRRFVFIRRVRLRAAPSQIGRAMEQALAKLAEESRQEFLSFSDLPALVVACAQASLSGGLGGWHWRMLGLPRTGSAGEAVAALLTAHPLEAGAAVAALAAHGLLAPVWRTMPEPAAARLLAALAFAMRFSVPAWPDARAVRPIGKPAASVTVLLQRAQATWAVALQPLPPQSEAVRAAAVLSLLRWSPGVLRTEQNPVWQTLLAHLAGEARFELRQAETAGDPQQPVLADNRVAPESSDPDPGPIVERIASPSPPPPSAQDASLPSHGEAIGTGWGGVLFLINALRRLHLEVLLDRAGSAAPTGWRLLHALGLAFGMPEDEPLAEFLAAQDLDTSVSPALLAELLGDLEALYRPDGPWPLPLAQRANLRATETHLDLDLLATDIDIALRLSGLDLDPGWVPWLGRVVAFHYDQLPTVFHRSG